MRRGHPDLDEYMTLLHQGPKKNTPQNEQERELTKTALVEMSRDDVEYAFRAERDALIGDPQVKCGRADDDDKQVEVVEEPGRVDAARPPPTAQEALRTTPSWLTEYVPSSPAASKHGCHRIERKNIWVAHYKTQLAPGTKILKKYAKQSRSRAWTCKSETEHTALQMVLRWAWDKHECLGGEARPQKVVDFLKPCALCKSTPAQCYTLSSMASGAGPSNAPAPAPAPQAPCIEATEFGRDSATPTKEPAAPSSHSNSGSSESSSSDSDSSSS